MTVLLDNYHSSKESGYFLEKVTYLTIVIIGIFKIYLIAKRNLKIEENDKKRDIITLEVIDIIVQIIHQIISYFV